MKANGTFEFETGQTPGQPEACSAWNEMCQYRTALAERQQRLEQGQEAHGLLHEAALTAVLDARELREEALTKGLPWPHQAAHLWAMMDALETGLRRVSALAARQQEQRQGGQ
jgi:hypothetical protein